MPVRRVIRPQSRRHMWVYDEDWDFIGRYAPRSGLQPGPWVREVLHKIVMQLREERHLNREAAERLLEAIETTEGGKQ